MTPIAKGGNRRIGQTAKLVLHRRRKQQRIGILRNVPGPHVDLDVTALRSEDARDQFQQRGLPRSIATHQRRHLATTQHQRHALDGAHAVIRVGDALESAHHLACVMNCWCDGRSGWQVRRVDPCIP